MDCSSWIVVFRLTQTVELSRTYIVIENTYTHNCLVHTVVVHAYENNVIISADDGDGNGGFFFLERSANTM